MHPPGEPGSGQRGTEGDPHGGQEGTSTEMAALQTFDCRASQKSALDRIWLSLPLQKPKEGDMERLGRVSVEGAVYWLVQPPFRASPGHHPILQTLKNEKQSSLSFSAGRGPSGIRFCQSDALAQDFNLELS